MFGVALELENPRIPSSDDPRARRIAQIVELRNQVAMSRDLLYCPPSIRTLIEEDIPALVSMVKGAR